ncbi:AAA family ATPase, partial [Pseudomonas aeruginosa]|nr:AAA family ATPase [Pseudomonas aeruginosa]
QGISGTGKTSLAKAFAKAMGGFCTDIAVQAGWRDRDDLLGHYNAFERRFYEKDCLQALYRAQTPRWRDTCNVILLDEMNLSRPEQYFAEFLSALEK